MNTTYPLVIKTITSLSDYLLNNHDDNDTTNLILSDQHESNLMALFKKTSVVDKSQWVIIQTYNLGDFDVIVINKKYIHPININKFWEATVQDIHYELANKLNNRNSSDDDFYQNDLVAVFCKDMLVVNKLSNGYQIILYGVK